MTPVYGVESYIIFLLRYLQPPILLLQQHMEQEYNAQSNFMVTSITAWKFSLASFIIPYMFIFRPSLHHRWV